MKSRLYGFGLLAVIGIILLAGLWPLEFSSPNGAVFLPLKKAFVFKKPGIVYLNGLRTESEGVRVRLVSVPYGDENEKGATILSFHDGRGREVVSLVQWNKSLLLRRFNNDGYFKREYVELGLKNITGSGLSTTISIQIGARDSTLEANGRSVSTAVFANGDDAERIKGVAIGSSPAGRFGWAGTVRDLRFNGKEPDFFIPPVCDPLFRTVLEWPFRDSSHKMKGLTDMLLNFTGFMPFGFLLGFRLKTPAFKGITAAIAAGFCLSLTIELVQVFMPGRFSSLSDLVLNTLGAGAGVLAARFIRTSIYPR